MRLSFGLSHPIVLFGVPLSLLAVLAALTQSPALFLHNHFDLAITLDMLVVVPFVYFLLIRKSSVPNTTVVPVIVLSTVLATYLLPSQHQLYLSLFKTWFLPVVELGVLGFIIYKVSSAIRLYRSSRAGTLDFFATLKEVCYQILPRPLVPPFATEVAVMYYTFVAWKQRSLKANEFTYHRNSGTPALLAALILVVVVETFALHLLLERWSPLAAWIATALSVYTTVQLIGFIKSMSRRPISAGVETLELRYGIMSETDIPYADIASVALSQEALEKDKLTSHMSLLSELEAHNVIIRLKRKGLLIKLYGIKKQYTTLALYIDQPQEFIRAIEQRLN